jgi:hypothetical protein
VRAEATTPPRKGGRRLPWVLKSVSINPILLASTEIPERIQDDSDEVICLDDEHPPLKRRRQVLLCYYQKLCFEHPTRLLECS